LPQPQPRPASRARRRSPDSATFQRETRAHQRATIPHTKKRFRSLRCPTRPKPSRVVSSTTPEPLPFGKDPGWYPEGTCRAGRDAVSWLCVLRRRGPLSHISNTPLSLTGRRSNLKRLEQRTDQPRPPLSPPARTGLVVLKAGVPSNPQESPDRGATPSSRDALISEEITPTEVESPGSPSRLFHRPSRPTLTGRPEAGGGDVQPPRGLRPTRQTVRHGASEILYEPVARRQGGRR